MGRKAIVGTRGGGMGALWPAAEPAQIEAEPTGIHPSWL
jgi:hypothetical protein